MWVLETDGDALQGKKLWLRPGKKFLFGRTQADAGQFVISDKTISRRHLTVEVDAAGPDECANTLIGSRVTLRDLDTKIGTLVNGEQIRGKTHVLQKDENVVALGKYKHRFTFTWIPITLTFSYGLKEARANPYASLYKLLGPIDIKVRVEYERGITTHLVAKKRNTPKGLQALIDGKFIVHNDSFINAIIAATTPIPSIDEGAVAKSPLEEDWIKNFPNPLGYLPPRGEEPTERDDSTYAPNVNRQDIFEGYTFIFYEKRQFDTLQAPITEGRGKALFREVVPSETLVEDFVQYVKGVAGEKGLGEFDDGSEGKGVVVVRFNPVKGPGSEWFSDFNRQVALYLDHRLVEQNEFLDAILGNDASVLRRPLELESSGLLAPPPMASTNVTSQTLRSSQPAPTLQSTPQVAPPEPARKGRSRRTVTTRFKGFDDDDDQVNLNSIPESSGVDQAPTFETQSQGLFVTQDPEMEIDQAEPQQATTQSRASRKRGTPPVDYDLEEENTLEQLAPAATAFKKRRLAEDIARRQRGEPTPPPPVIKERLEPKSQQGKVKPEVDLFELARKKREKAEEKAREQREGSEEAALDAKDIEALRDLAIIEEIEVTRVLAPLRVTHADDSDRWDDRWNGRKNFKKFRRRGADSGLAKNFHRVIVPLEEVRKKDFGIGDDYWLETDAQRKKKKVRGRNTQDDFESQSQARQKNRAARTADILASEAEEEITQAAGGATELPSSDVEIVEPGEPSLSPAPTPKSKPVVSKQAQRTEKSVDKASASQNLPAKKKRSASSGLTKPPPAKKVKQAIRNEDSDDSDDDELRFKFKKRV